MVRESTKAFNVYEHIEGHAPNNTRVHNEDTQRLEQARQLMAKITVLIKEDNLPATHAVKNAHGSFLRLRHIAAHYHWVRELHEMGIIRVVHVPGKEQEADFLTKTSRRQNSIGNREDWESIKKKHEPTDIFYTSYSLVTIFINLQLINTFYHSPSTSTLVTLLLPCPPSTLHLPTPA